MTAVRRETTLRLSLSNLFEAIPAVWGRNCLNVLIVLRFSYVLGEKKQ